MKTQITITIRGNEWFDNTYGNSYHNSIVDIDGQRHQSGIEYGYGDQYIQTANELLISLNAIPDGFSIRRWKDLEILSKQHNIKIINLGIKNTLKRNLTENIYNTYY